jgi:hypothetical protein
MRGVCRPKINNGGSGFHEKGCAAGVRPILTASSKIKMMTQADRQRHIVNVTIQVK